MTATLDVRSLLRQHRQTKAGDVHDLARRLAADEIIPPEEIIAAIQASGMSDDWFLDLTDLCRRRAELRRTAAGLEAHEQELAGVRSAIAAHRAALDAAEAKYRAAVLPLARQEDDVQGRISSTISARTALTAASNVPKHLYDAMEAARVALHQASSAAQQKQVIAEREQERSDAAREKLDKHHGGADRALAKFNGGDSRRDHPAEWTELCERVKYGGFRAATAREELVVLIAARDAAEKAYKAAEKACYDF